MHQAARLIRRDGHYVPASSTEAELDARQVIEMTYRQDARWVATPITTNSIAHSLLGIESFQIDFDVRRRDAELYRQRTHGIGLVSCSCPRSSREQEPLRQTGSMQLNARPDAISQRH